jgi:hypothetical protein
LAWKRDEKATGGGVIYGPRRNENVWSSNFKWSLAKLS